MRQRVGNEVVRSFTPEDAPSLARHADDPRIAAGLRDHFPSPYTEAFARRWIALLQSSPRETCFAIASGDDVIGAVGVHPQQDVHRRSAELGYWLSPRYWGQGIATAAVRFITPWAFHELDLIRIQAFVFEGNPASVRVLEKAGYQLEGLLRKSVVKNGRILDQLLYARVREDTRIPSSCSSPKAGG